MDRRPTTNTTNYPYPRRSRPLRNYAEDDDDLSSDNDVILSSHFSPSSSSSSDHHHQHHFSLLRHPKKHRTTHHHNSLWSEPATFILLDIWGERFLHHGRSSLRSDDWSDVADRVSASTRVNFSVSDCRNRLFNLKSRYLREKSKINNGGSHGNSFFTKWPYFKKMDALMTMSPMQLQQQEQCALACGLDSGEFVFMNPRVYLENSNALDEMRDSPAESEQSEEDGSGSDDEDENEEEAEEEMDEEVAEEEYRMLSESIKKVGEIYERIEDSKKQHMVELERMRAEFHRELEVQKKEIIDRTKAEVAKISRQDDEGENEEENEEESEDGVSYANNHNIE